MSSTHKDISSVLAGQSLEAYLFGLPRIAANRVIEAINNKNITTLELGYMNLCSKDILKIADLLSFTNVTTLDVQGNKVGDDGAIALANNTTLTTLDIKSNHIRAAGAKALAANTTLTTLNVQSNILGADGAKALAANTTLTTLNVQSNILGADGAKALAANTTLTTLNVRDNNIGADGAKALAANTTLTTLNVGVNNIGADGAIALANNTTLTTLYVWGNDISDDNERLLEERITLNRQNLVDFRNEVSVIGQGMRDQHSFFGQLPVEMTHEIINALAASHGLFTSRRLEEDVNRNLLPKGLSAGRQLLTQLTAQHSPLGEALQQEVARLAGTEKEKGILKALSHFTDNENIEAEIVAALLDRNSPLSQAINTHRNIIPITFWGARSLLSSDTRSYQKLLRIAESWHEESNEHSPPRTSF